MKSSEVIKTIESIGVVPLVRASLSEHAERAVEAVIAGGIPIFEITMDVPDALRLIERFATCYDGRAIVGAGTVLRADQARSCIDAGAAFVVSPTLDVPTIELARGRGIAVIPGALTPTEVLTAWRAGADLIKLFPVSAVGGPKYLKSLKAPFPGIKLLAAGGVSLANLHEFIQAGASAVGVGTELIEADALPEALGHPSHGDTLTERAASFIRAVAAARARV